MKIRFWGTRGSIAKPGPDTIRYGGNTSCVEVRTADNALIVIDCGTGAHGLGQQLMAEKKPIRGTLLISHTHWDHIQGLPFFAPLFVPENEWDIYAPRGLSQTLRETLAGQMQYTYFPVSLESLGATIRYHDLVEGALTIGNVRVQAQYLNHPALTLGYRLEADGMQIVYACDHECSSKTAAPSVEHLLQHESKHVGFLHNADLVIHDSQYTAEEYPQKVGWGHSTVDYAVTACKAAGVKRLALTHHDPSRHDVDIDAILDTVNKAAGDMEIVAAAEGMEIDLGTRETDSAGATPAFVSTGDQATHERDILLGMRMGDAADVICKAARAEDLIVERWLRDDEPQRLTKYHEHPLLIVDASDDVSEVRSALKKAGATTNHSASILVVAEELDTLKKWSGMHVDYMLWPFTEQYVRTKLRANILSLPCRWIRATEPEHEAQRLQSLRGLQVLDTEPEERFDALTRGIANELNVPIALVSLVDENRQWFKSRVGVDASETPRDMAFCAHAILDDPVFMVPDTLQDDRFADNPLVTHAPRIRFYAGCPLKSPDGMSLGTLCVIDTKPRELGAHEIALLEDTAKRVESALKDGA